MKPIFHWTGSKTRSAESIISEFPTFFNNYYEPFLGSSAVYLHMDACFRRWNHSFLSDANGYLVNCYRAVCDDPERVSKIVENMCLRNSEEFYNEMRKQISNPSVFIYIMRACFNSLYKEDKDGEFCTPWRKHDFTVMKRKILADVSMIPKFAAYVMKHPATFTPCNWERGLSGGFFTHADTQLMGAGKDDVVYLDPPALPYNDTGFVNYVSGGFNEADHIYLNNYAKQLKAKGCHVFLSNSISAASLRIYGTPKKELTPEKDKRQEGLWVY